MTFSDFLNKNGSIILTILSGIGLIGTSILCVRAGMKLQKEQQNDETNEEKRTRIIKTLIPSAIAGTTTLGIIISNCILDERRYRSLMALYSIATNSLAVSSNKESSEQTKIKEKTFIPNPTQDEELFYDFYHGYFTSTRNKVLDAECQFNKQFVQEGYVTLNDWYGYLGLKPISGIESVAWYDGSCHFSDNEPIYEGIINFEHEMVKLENNEEGDLEAMVIHINITTPPTVCVDTLY